MPLIAHALFYFAYAVTSTAIASALIRFTDAGIVQAILAGLAAFAAMAVSHAAYAVAQANGALEQSEKRMRMDMEQVRTGQRRLESHIGTLSARIDDLDMTVQEVAMREMALPPPQAAPAPAMIESRMVEQLVEKLGRAVDARIEEVRRVLPFSGGPRRTIDFVREALTEGRIELHLQPIVTLPQRRTAFYEGFTRLKDDTGRVIMPDEFLAPAETNGLMPQIDNMLLFRCVQIVRRLAEKDRRVGVFCNLSPRSLIDDQFFPGFLEFLGEHRDLAGALIFEIPQAAFEARTAAQARAMGRLADLGFSFSLDRVQSLAIDLIDCERANVRFIKSEGAALVRQLTQEQVRPRGNLTREISPRDVATIFRRHNIELIAERMESEAVIVEVLDLDVALGQGNVFGAARPIKDKLMSETAPPPGYFNERAVG